jgi:hypothetical protein
MSHFQGFPLAAGISIAVSSVVFGVMFRPLPAASPTSKDPNQFSGDRAAG